MGAKIDTGPALDGGPPNFSVDIVARTADIRLARARVDRRRWRTRGLLLSFGMGIGMLSYILGNVVDLQGLAVEHLGYALAFFLVVLPLGIVLDMKHIERLALKIQRKKPASMVHVTEDAFIFSPGSPKEIHLRRSDAIAIVRDPKKKGESETGAGAKKRLCGIVMETSGRQIQVLDKCLSEYDMMKIVYLIASWGQSFDQMLEAFVQSGMAHAGNRGNLSDIAENLGAPWQFGPDSIPSPRQIDTLIAPVTARAIAVRPSNITEPEFQQDIKFLPGYSLYFEWHDEQVYAVFRRDSDMTQAPQTLGDIIEQELGRERNQLQGLEAFLAQVETNADIKKVAIAEGFLPKSDARMAAKEVFGLQPPYLRADLQAGLQNAMT